MNRPKRGRKRTLETVERQLASVTERLAEADPLSRLHLSQQREDLQKEIERYGKKVDVSGLEADFVKAAKDYGQRKGLSYAAWRAAGVAPAILRRAGITRGGRGS